MRIDVKEIYDKCWEIKRTRPDCIILISSMSLVNAAWHYNATGSAIEEVFKLTKGKNSKLAAYISATGSAGTIAAGDYLRTIAPHIKVVASEALQCPTLLMNGFGGHRIEGIGDKHVPWVHNVKNTDVVTAIDDEDCMRILRLFNEKEGHDYLKSIGIDINIINQLHLIGFLVSAMWFRPLKLPKYFEMTGDDIIITIATDSADMYKSRVEELTAEKGKYNEIQAIRDLRNGLSGTKSDNMKELNYNDRNLYITLSTLHG